MRNDIKQLVLFLIIMCGIIGTLVGTIYSIGSIYGFISSSNLNTLDILINGFGIYVVLIFFIIFLIRITVKEVKFES